MNSRTGMGRFVELSSVTRLGSLVASFVLVHLDSLLFSLCCCETDDLFFCGFSLFSRAFSFSLCKEVFFVLSKKQKKIFFSVRGVHVRNEKPKSVPIVYHRKFTRVFFFFSHHTHRRHTDRRTDAGFFFLSV